MYDVILIKLDRYLDYDTLPRARVLYRFVGLLLLYTANNLDLLKTEPGRHKQRKDKCVLKGAGRTCKLRGLARQICNQIQMGIDSLNTLRWILQRSEELELLLWQCPQCDELDSSPN